MNLSVRLVRQELFPWYAERAVGQLETTDLMAASLIELVGMSSCGPSRYLLRYNGAACYHVA
jgi:hypothetical protein